MRIDEIASLLTARGSIGQSARAITATQFVTNVRSFLIRTGGIDGVGKWELGKINALIQDDEIHHSKSNMDGINEILSRLDCDVQINILRNGTVSYTGSF